MAVRLIAVDLDDTLLTPERGIHEIDRAAIAQATANGIVVVPNSGRMAVSTRPYAQDLGLKYVAACNGAHIVDLHTGETLLREGLSAAQVAAVTRWGNERGLYMQVYYGDIYEFDTRCKYSDDYKISSGIEGVEVGPLWEKARESEKILLIGDSDELTRRMAEMREAFPDLVFAKSKPYFVEIMSPKAGKDAAMTWLCGRLGISPDETMAIGDSENDLPMIRWAKLGVAMGNASQAVKDAAQHITADNRSGGVGQAIRRFALEG